MGLERMARTSLRALGWAILGRGPNSIAQLLPYLLRNGKEDLHNVRVELLAGMALNFLPSLRNGLSGSIGPTGSYGFESISDGENARPEWNLPAL